jgi:hypothetical protein
MINNKKEGKYSSKSWEGWATVLQYRENYQVLIVRRKGLVLAYTNELRTQYSRIDDPKARRFATELHAIHSR